MAFDILIIGGGHAGVEAALAGSRMGRKVGLISMDPSRLALMSCNPAIGGVGKSHVVKEIDALGGIMGEAIDATGIQFRMLNLSKGPAVWSTRAQADRIGYNRFIVDIIGADNNIEVIAATAEKLLVENGVIIGVATENGESIAAKAVIIAAGTFLGAIIHIGEKQQKAGRMGEKSATSLSISLIDLGFETGRLKTGTPPRLDGETIDWSKCTIQPGDNPIPFFSTRSKREPFEQANCHLTYTTAMTKRIIKDNLDRSPMFTGRIKGVGPRYCPSIEDKIFRFADKERHQIFLEPEGNGTSEVYPNGFSTSLPEEIQAKAIRSVIGLEEVKITIPGYAVEYDYCPARQVKPSLETKRVRGLFFAGQINGTSGYEEAAGQGLMAGINAALYLSHEPPFILDRSEAYIGVMIDDLASRSTTEPYRLFTSRAEYRLTLREDNARDRLTSYAQKYGLLPSSETTAFRQLQDQTNKVLNRFSRIRLESSEAGAIGARFKTSRNISLSKLLKQPGLSLNEAVELISNYDTENSACEEAMRRAAIIVRYEGYIDRQQREIDKFKRSEKELIPGSFDYATITGLKHEAREKLERFRPISLGQASRMEGITPGDLSVLSVHLARAKWQQR